MNGQGNNISQPTIGRSESGGDRDVEEQGALLHDRSDTTSGVRVKYFSMFSGVGGFEKGIGELGECIGFSEIDKYSLQTYLKNFPDHINFGDATKIDPTKLPDFDMLCGGFPCQAFSIAGKRRGFEDTRGTMFFEIARILKVKRPKLVFLENVKGLLNHNKGQTFSTIIQAVEELGYNIQWMVLNSKFFGVPQNRERVFIIGSLRGERRPEILPFGSISQEIINLQGQQIHPTITEAIGRAGSSSEYKSSLATITNTIKARHLADANGSYIAENKFISQEKPMIMDLYNHTESSEVCPTLKEPHHNDRRVREGTKIRRLTPVECERLQGFPDGWTEGVSDTQRYKQMGNAVTTNVIKAIAERLI